MRVRRNLPDLARESQRSSCDPAAVVHHHPSVLVGELLTSARSMFDAVLDAVLDAASNQNFRIESNNSFAPTTCDNAT